MYAYISLVVFLLFCVGLWDVSYIKDTVFWSVSAATVSLFRIPTIADDEHHLRNALADNLKIIIVLEFIVNAYTFSLAIEVFLVPLIAIISAMLIYAENKKEYASVTKLLSGLMIIFVIALALFSAHMIAKNSSDYFRVGTLTDFALPIVLSALFLPFIVTLVIYLRYENAFMRIRFIYSHVPLQKRAMRIALCRFHVRTVLLKRWLRHIQSNRPQDFESLEASVIQVKKFTMLEKKPPIVPSAEGWSPYLACKFMQNVGVIAKDYRPDGSGQSEWFACSSYIEIEGGSISDYIAYYVEGDEQAVHTLKIVVNIGDARASHCARNRFSEAAEELIRKALHEDMPSTLREAIVEESPKKLSVGKAVADFSTETWQDQKNCELSLSLRHESAN